MRRVGFGEKKCQGTAAYAFIVLGVRALACGSREGREARCGWDPGSSPVRVRLKGGDDEGDPPICDRSGGRGEAGCDRPERLSGPQVKGNTRI